MTNEKQSGIGSESAHWYEVERETGAFGGDPVVSVKLVPPQIIGKNGKARKPTLRDARDNGWYPSVTTIQQIIAKPGLQKWKTEQVLLAALTLPHVKGETDEAFVKRVIADSDSWRKETAQTGKDIHAELSDSLLEPNYTPETKAGCGVADSVRGWLKEMGARNVRSEVGFASLKYGFAGTADIIADGKKPIIADLKTTDMRKFKNPYIEWSEQLAGYMLGVGMDDADAFSIVADRNTGTTKIIQWQPLDIDKARDVFLATLKIWQLRTGHYPQTKGNLPF